MASLKYIADVNLMKVTLASAYTAADGHMHLTGGHGARLPATGDFGSEQRVELIVVLSVLLVQQMTLQ